MPTTFTLNSDGSLPTKAIVDELYKLTEEFSLEEYPQKHREHLGASIIGEKCRRKLWYGFRWCKLPTPEGRMRRLWQRGHDEEEKIDTILTWMGFFVREIDPVTNRQYKFSELNGHFGGSSDVMLLLPWFRTEDMRILGEKKTHNKKSFDTLKNLGVVKAHPKHFAQMSVYGAAFKVKYGLYIAICKDNDDIHYELLELDWDLAAELHNKAKDIIESKFPPEKISNDPNFFECKWCDFQHICHWGELVEVNCRSCKMASPVEKGQWHCSQWGNIIPAEFVGKGCEKHQSINE